MHGQAAVPQQPGAVTSAMLAFAAKTYKKAERPTVGPKKPPTTSALDQTSWYNLKATARPKLITASVPVRFRTPLSRYGCLQNFDG